MRAALAGPWGPQGWLIAGVVMLQKIRETLTGWVALAFVAIIGLSLALSFGNSPTLTGRDYAARVNGEDIPVNEYRQVYQNQLIAQQEQFGGELPGFFVEQLQREVLEGLVINRVIRQHVRDQGFRVSDQRVADEIRSLPALQVGGEFSPQTYIALLAQQGLSPTRFEQEQREALAVQQLTNGVIGSSFFTPGEFRRYLLLEGEQREVAVVVFDPRELSRAVDVSVPDEEVEAFYAANQERFVTEESVRLQYVELNLDALAAGFEVDDDELRAAYEAERSRFTRDEERRARHILVAVNSNRDEAAARERAAAVIARLAAGEDFAALAREYSDDPGSAAQGGDLGFAPRGVFVGAFEESLFALAEGETSDPVRTEFGFHVIRLEAVRGESGLPFEEARAELLVELQRQAAEDAYFRLADQLDDLSQENRGSLEPAAERTSLELREIPVFTRSGGAPLGFNPQLVSAVFGPASLEDGENTPLIELADGRAVVARVVEYRPAVVRPLAEVRAQIIAQLGLERAAQAARNRGERLLERAGAGEPLATLAEELGGSFTDTVAVGRREQNAAPELLEAIFNAPRPPAEGQAVWRGLPLSNGGYAVFGLSAVVPGRAEDLPREVRDQRKALLAQAAGNQELEAMASQLRRDAKVVVRQDVFQAQDPF
jgi:peptidyl-prolyl cis-trans isomerase D